ncbi:hypothetical protein BH10PAT4_BH10PAT4_0390 [soil metagenome]
MALDIEYITERHAGRWVALIVFVCILALAGWVAYKWYTSGDLPVAIPVASANSGVDEVDVSYDDVNTYTVPDQHPRYISIPSLNLGKTRVYSVGLDVSNLVEASANVHDTSWYDKSATPGDGGVVVMNGHNKGINKNGAFYNLSRLSSGDSITIERGDGEVFTYKVAETQTLTLDDLNNDGLARIGKSAVVGKEGLNLITFDGKWVPRLGTFDQRTIVRAVIDDSE